MKEILYLRQLPGGGEGPASSVQPRVNPLPGTPLRGISGAAAHSWLSARRAATRKAPCSPCRMARAAALAAGFEVRN